MINDNRIFWAVTKEAYRLTLRAYVLCVASLLVNLIILLTLDKWVAVTAVVMSAAFLALLCKSMLHTMRFIRDSSAKARMEIEQEAARFKANPNE